MYIRDEKINLRKITEKWICAYTGDYHDPVCPHQDLHPAYRMLADVQMCLSTLLQSQRQNTENPKEGVNKRNEKK